MPEKKKKKTFKGQKNSRFDTLKSFLLTSPPPEPPQPSSSSQSPLERPSASPLPVSIWSSEPSLGMDFPCNNLKKKKVK